MSVEIYQRLNSVFRNVFDDDNLDVDAGTTANDISDWDSLRHIRLIVAVEKEFGIKFLSSEVNDFKNVGELADRVQSKLS